MTPGDAVRAAQVAAMTDPDRVQLLALVLSAPLGQVTIASLAGPDADDQDRVAGLDSHHVPSPRRAPGRGRARGGRRNYVLPLLTGRYRGFTLFRGDCG